MDLLDDEYLRAKLVAVERVASDLWKKDTIFHKYFTVHGVDHSRNVLENLNDLVPPRLMAELNRLEVFSLAAAAWLHDIGMMYLLRGEDPGNDEVVRRIRNEHHARSEKLIHSRRFPEVRALFTGPERNIVGIICRAHGLRSVEDLREWSVKGYGTIRVPYLAALLRLADVCDVTYRRDSILQNILPLPKESFEHWAKMRYVSDVRLRKVGQAYDIVLYVMVPMRDSKKYEQLVQGLVLLSIADEVKVSGKILASHGLTIGDVVSDVQRVKSVDPIPHDLLLEILSRCQQTTPSKLNEAENLVVSELEGGRRSAYALASRLGMSVKAVENVLDGLVDKRIVAVAGQKWTQRERHGHQLTRYTLASARSGLDIGQR